MAKSRNDILFRFLADTKSLEKGTKKAKKSMGGVQASAKKMAGVLAAAFGAREIARFGQDAITASTDFVESINAVEVSTGDAAAEILKLGETAATAFGLSKIEINEAAVAFAAFGEKIDTSGNIAEVFQEFIGRATDFASVMNIEVGEALVKFQSGLAGETEPLRRFGIDISAASTKLFAMENNIGEVGRELTETEKVQARYGLLLQQTEKFAGDFANTQGEVANQTRISNAELENAKIQLGNELMPLQQEWVRFQRNALIPVLLEFVGVLNILSGTVEGFISDVADAADASLSFADRVLGAKNAMQELLFVSATGVLGVVARDFLEADEAVEEFTEHIDPLLDAMSDIRIRAGLAASEQRDLIKALGEDIDAGELSDYLGTLKETIRAIRDAIELRTILGGGTPSFGFGGDGDIVGLAHGGTIQPGGTALVGERGPEIISPRGGARITPINGGGGGGTVVNVEFTGVVGDPVAVAEQIQDLLELYGRTNNAF